MSTSQDPFGDSGRSDAPPSDEPRSDRSLPRILFWVLIAALYLLGALSLLVRGWFDIGPTDAGSPIAVVTAAATAIPTLDRPAAVTPVPAITPQPPAGSAASATPHPTLTPRRTPYPTLTPRP